MSDDLDTAPAPRKIDAHLHLWDRGRGGYDWLESAPSALSASFLPAQAEAELRASGIDGAVLVQAEDSLRDTEFMLETAAAHPWVLGVVGWVQLDEPAEA